MEWFVASLVTTVVIAAIYVWQLITWFEPDRKLLYFALLGVFVTVLIGFWTFRN
jgi:hypothetical protein